MNRGRLAEVLAWAWVATVLALYLAQFRPLLGPFMVELGWPPS
jgi:hypothetical protein